MNNSQVLDWVLENPPHDCHLQNEVHLDCNAIQLETGCHKFKWNGEKVNLRNLDSIVESFPICFFGEWWLKTQYTLGMCKECYTNIEPEIAMQSSIPMPNIRGMLHHSCKPRRKLMMKLIKDCCTQNCGPRIIFGNYPGEEVEGDSFPSLHEPSYNLFSSTPTPPRIEFVGSLELMFALQVADLGSRTHYAQKMKYKTHFKTFFDIGYEMDYPSKEENPNRKGLIVVLLKDWEDNISQYVDLENTQSDLFVVFVSEPKMTVVTFMYCLYRYMFHGFKTNRNVLKLENWKKWEAEERAHIEDRRELFALSTDNRWNGLELFGDKN